MGGHKQVILAAHREFCSRRFAEKPELTLRGLQTELSAQGIELSYGAIWAFVQVRNFMR